MVVFLLVSHSHCKCTHFHLWIVGRIWISKSILLQFFFIQNFARKESIFDFQAWKNQYFLPKKALSFWRQDFNFFCQLFQLFPTTSCCSKIFWKMHRFWIYDFLKLNWYTIIKTLKCFLLKIFLDLLKFLIFFELLLYLSISK